MLRELEQQQHSDKNSTLIIITVIFARNYTHCFSTILLVSHSISCLREKAAVKQHSLCAMCTMYLNEMNFLFSPLRRFVRRLSLRLSPSHLRAYAALLNLIYIGEIYMCQTCDTQNFVCCASSRGAHTHVRSNVRESIPK